jgi:ubiquinone/menaquinone biosynthesis C-methylase UbiE/DNA-binding transcriptional ArsR family regulator
MPSIVKILRVVADPNRLRILLLLRTEELSVAELQEILTMGQSTISTHLSQLKQTGLVEDRRTGKSSLYRLATHTVEGAAVLKERDFNAREKKHPELPEMSGHDFTAKGKKQPEFRQASGHDFSRAESSTELSGPLGPEGASTFSARKPSSFLDELLARAAQEIPEASADQSAMRSVLKKRQDKMRSFFDSVAGRLGRDYVPGKSWKSLAEAFLLLMPPMVIADLGAGEGAFSLLLAQRAKKVIAVDTSAKMIEVAREQALRHGVKNVDYRLGDMEELPIRDAHVDLVFFSQSLHHALHPERAVSEASRILKPGGRIVILDLVKHRFEEARELYADEWLGFSESELESMLMKAGFTNIQTNVVHKEQETPNFQTLLAVAGKPLTTAS